MQKVQNQTISFADPGGDANYAVLQVPSEGTGWTVVGANVISDTALAQGDTNVVSVALNSGTDLAGADVVGAAVHNGTSGGAAWVAQEVRAFTLDSTEVYLEPGDFLIAVYDETGTVAPKNTTVSVNYVEGKR